jgi:anti-sigma regulatory factor (Ser/Thr protein kinase)
MDEVTLRIASNLSAPGLTRSHLKKFQTKLEPRYEDVVLVVSELVTNAVRHGSSDGIDLKVAKRGGRIRVEVTDHGSGFSVDDPRGDGLGLNIVERLADSWGMKTGKDKFTVWAELSASPPG